MKITEKTGNKLIQKKKNRYNIKEIADNYLIKEIKIEKKPLKYAFIGGMYYNKDKEFNLQNNEIHIPYPFSTYYITKIVDKKINNSLCRSLYYCKLPLIVLQFKDEAISIEFEPLIKLNNEEVNPFISINEEENYYKISFYLFTKFKIKEKKHAWLGISKKISKKIKVNKKEQFTFPIKIKKDKKWHQPVKEKIEKNLSLEKPKKPISTYKKAKQALNRSYDHLTGSFLQLPWKDTTGFTLIESSYSLLSYEAVRLHYFSKWKNHKHDENLEKWIKKLRSHFINPKLYTTQLKKGKGLAWYNMTNLTKKGLQGYFYLGCGYGGYPGGQGTIAYHLLMYLQETEDKEIEKKVKKSIQYILSTQNNDGSWPMAIKQEGISLRPEKLDEYKTSGGTSECIRALLAGYERFGDEKMKTAALKALDFLKTENPICYNGLRDIGTQEAEAFSAMSIIEAFLDAYKIFSKEKYLQQAKIYAYYTLTWIYLYNTENLDLKWDFHPISQSITPRLSPYESIYMVSVLNRLNKVTKEEYWKKIAHLIYNNAKKWITKNGGLSEGIFPKYLQKQVPLPMEQTFATVELMNASRNITDYTKKQKEKTQNKKNISKKIDIKKEEEKIIFYYEKEIILIFNTQKCKISYIKNADLNKYGISFSFDNPYSKLNRFKQKAIKKIRSKHGKYLLGIKNADFFINGVHPPKEKTKDRITPFEKIEKTEIKTKIDKNKVSIKIKTFYHKISLDIKLFSNKKTIEFIFDPIKIEVLDHDLYCRKVLFPVIGSKIIKKKNNKLFFEEFSVETKNKNILSTEEYVAIDQTRKANWTHGGIFKGNFRIKIQK